MATVAQILEVRDKLGDTGTVQRWSDTELGRIIDKWSNLSLAAAKAIRALIVKSSIGATLSEGAYSRSHNLDALEKAAKALEDEAAADGININGEEIAYFDIAEEVYTEDNAEQIIDNQIIRNELP